MYIPYGLREQFRLHALTKSFTERVELEQSTLDEVMLYSLFTNAMSYRDKEIFDFKNPKK